MPWPQTCGVPAALDLAKQPHPGIAAQHRPQVLKALHHGLDHLALMQIKHKANHPHSTIAA